MNDAIKVVGGHTPYQACKQREGGLQILHLVTLRLRDSH